MRILITGFFGEGNLGDEAILEGLCKSIPKNASIKVTAGQSPLLVKAGRIQRRGVQSWPLFLKAARQASHFITSGGILQDWSWDGTMFFALRMLAAKLLGCQVGVVGAGIGPLRSSACQAISKTALNHADTLWLRDKGSLELLQKLTGTQGKLGTDWSWNLSPSSSSGRPHSEASLTGINIRPWANHDWIAAIVQAIKKIESSGQVGIPARAEDVRLMRRLIPELDIQPVNSFSQLLSLSQHSLSWGVSMRYHVTMALLRMNVPVCALPYDPKVGNLCADADISPWENPIATPPMFQRASILFRSDNIRRLTAMKEGLNDFLSQPKALP